MAFKAPKRHTKEWHTKECVSDPESANTNGQDPSEISRGRWPRGQEPSEKHQIPLPTNMNLWLCVSLGPEKTTNTEDRADDAKQHKCPHTQRRQTHGTTSA